MKKDKCKGSGHIIKVKNETKKVRCPFCSRELQPKFFKVQYILPAHKGGE